jgi:hypothetical protein
VYRERSGQIGKGEGEKKIKNIEERVTKKGIVARYQRKG